MTEALTGNKIHETESVFKKHDTTNEGKIGISKVGMALTELGIPWGKDDLDVFLSPINPTNANKINLDQFKELVTIASQNDSLSKNMLETFKLFDKNGDGKLTKSEIRHILNSSENFDVDASDLDHFFEQLDTDQNGYIDYYEFIRCIS